MKSCSKAIKRCALDIADLCTPSFLFICAFHVHYRDWKSVLEPRGKVATAVEIKINFRKPLNEIVQIRISFVSLLALETLVFTDLTKKKA